MRAPTTLASTLTGVVLVALVAAGCTGGSDSPATTTTPAPPVETTTTTEVPIDEGEQLFLYAPTIGDCFDRRQLDEPDTSHDDQVDIVLKLDCEQLHRFEVFDVLEYPNDSDTFPGDPALRAFANQHCTKNFAAYVGKPYELSELDFGFYVTPEKHWSERPQAFACTLYEMAGGRTTGSAAGSAR